MKHSKREHNQLFQGGWICKNRGEGKGRFFTTQKTETVRTVETTAETVERQQ